MTVGEKSSRRTVKRVHTRDDEPPMAQIHEYIAANGSGIGVLISGVFAIRTPSEAEKLATLLACHCPDPDRTAPGIWELLSNAIEHGNLGLTFNDKTELLRKGTFHLEVDRRLGDKAYVNKQVRVEFDRQPSRISITITDEGEGFDFEAALQHDFTLDLPNGRGIAIAARLSFDSVVYRGCGNRVEAAIQVPA